MQKKPPPKNQEEKQQQKNDRDRNYFVNKSASILLKELEGFTIDEKKKTLNNNKTSNKEASHAMGKIISLFDEKGRG